jgi:hypothetical protein
MADFSEMEPYLQLISLMSGGTEQKVSIYTISGLDKILVSACFSGHNLNSCRDVFSETLSQKNNPGLAHRSWVI